MKKILLTTTAILLATSFSTTAMALTYAEALESCSDCDLWNRATSNHADNKDLNTGQYLYNDANGNTIGIYYYSPMDYSKPVFNVNVVYNAYLNKSFAYTCTGQDECNSPLDNQFVFLCEGTCYPTYDDNANLSTLTYLDSTTGRTILGKEGYTYEWDGTLIAKTYMDGETGLTDEYTCTDKDNCTKTGTYAYTYEESTVFDGQSNLISKIGYDNTGTPISTEEYAYDTLDNLIAKTYTDLLTGAVTEYTCAAECTPSSTSISNGNLTQKITYDSNGNPTGTETSAKIFTAEQAYAATSKGNNNSFSIRFK